MSRSFGVLGLLLGGALVFGALNAVAAKKAGSPDRVKRGAYLVALTGCNDCHTPMKFDAGLKMPVPDMSRALSGHPAGAPEPGGTLGQGDIALFGPTFTAVKQPFGTVYAANLTPDRDTGLGSWTEKDFIATMRTGKHLGTGRQILPPMPWLDLSNGSEEDLGAIFAYLQSIPAIPNAVPPPRVEPAALEGMEKSFQALRNRMRSASAR